MMLPVSPHSLSAYTPSLNGQFGDSHRNDLHGPGFSDVDFSVFKNTKVTKYVNAQFRVEMFNLFNRLNLAQPGDGFCTDTNNGANPDAATIAASKVGSAITSGRVGEQKARTARCRGSLDPA